ncbi:MAG: GNAT family N-acetyltransferase [Anaerolineae bacterium]|nr:GNAT family N-acetyltransferase [Anaerolineae bacterium]
MNTAPTLTTERLLIRPFTLADVDDYQRVLHSDPAVMRYLPGGVTKPRNETAAELQGYIDHCALHGYGFEALIERATGAFVGDVGLDHLDDQVAIGYTLGSAFWGKGYATEAARAVLAYGFDVLQLKAIVAIAQPENTASRRVLERLGMTYAGETDRYYDTIMAVYHIEHP